MKRIKSMLLALTAVSALALSATSCEKVSPDAPAGSTPDSAAVTDAENSAAAPDGNSSTEDAKTTEAGEDIGKPPKMNENNLVEQQKVNDGPTLTLPDIEASAGEEVSFKVDMTDNDGITALVSWIDINTKYFEYVSCVGGDADDEENEDSVMYSNLTANPYTKEDAVDTTTLVCMYFDGSQQSFKENTTYATITLKVKEDTPAGKYDLAFDSVGDGGAMCNDYDRENGVLLIRTPTYKNGSITVK